jgi:hypothetical protein
MVSLLDGVLPLARMARFRSSVREQMPLARRWVWTLERSNGGSGVGLLIGALV